MKTNTSINLNTRDINNLAIESRIIKTILRRALSLESNFAVLELSTKAVKLLIGKDINAIKANIASLGANAPGVKFEFSNFLRLADKVDAGKGLDAQNVMNMRFFSDRVLSSILDKKMHMLDHGVDTVYTVATAAYRTAANREEILDLIRKQAKINVRILSKSEEATATLFAYTFTSAHRMKLLESSRVIMIDQGGGSTEVSVFKKGGNLVGDPYSMNLGTTALRNFLFRDSAPNTPIGEAFKNSDRKCRERLVTFSKNMDESMSARGDAFCVGVGTAITKAVGRSGNAKQHDKILTREFIQNRITKAEAIVCARVQTVGELDVLLRTLGPNDPFDAEVTARVGLPMFEMMMEKYGIPEIHVSGTGLWYGIYFQRLFHTLDEN